MVLDFSRYYRKSEIAQRFSVTTRAVDLWVARGFLAPAIKLGNTKQARVRWDGAQVAALEERLRTRGGGGDAPTTLAPSKNGTPRHPANDDHGVKD